MYNFRSTLLPLPYMAPMVAIYWAACPQDMARPSRCWSPACSCHLVFAFNSIWIWLHKAHPVKTETLMDESTSITKLYPRFHNCYGCPIDFYCWRSQARVQQTWHQGCSGKSGYFCQKQHDTPSCCRAASITKFSLPSSWLRCRSSRSSSFVPWNFLLRGRYIHTNCTNFIQLNAATWLQVKDILLDCALSSPGTRPIICIDECQVWKIFK